MRITAILERPSGALEDISINADPGATIADLARSIIVCDPRNEYADTDPETTALEVRASDGSSEVEDFDPHTTLEDIDLGSGLYLRLISEHATEPVPVGTLTIHSGPDAGTTVTIDSGNTTIGRDPSATVRLADPTVSKLHARIHARPGRAEIVDLNSANGVQLGGAIVARANLAAGTVVTLGETEISLHLSDVEPTQRSSLQMRRFTRTPRVETRFGAQNLESAELPTEDAGQPFPWLVMMMPLVAGGAMFAMTRSPFSLVFIALSPLMMLGNWIQTRSRGRRGKEDSLTRFSTQFSRLEERLRQATRDEVHARRDEVPSLEAVFDSVRNVKSPLWTRRPEHWSFLFVRLGMGSAPSRVSVRDPAGRDRALEEHERRFDEVVSRFTDVNGVPIVEDLSAAGALGIIGDDTVAAAYARGLVAQIGGLHSPTDVVIAGVLGDYWADQLEHAKWMPHAAAAESVLGRSFGVRPNGAAQLLGRLEELVEQRRPRKASDRMLGELHPDESALKSGAKVGEGLSAARTHAEASPAVIVFIGDDAPVETARLIQLTENAVGTGVYPIWLTRSKDRLPGACRTFVTFDDDARAQVDYVRLGTRIKDVDAEGLSLAHARQFSLAMARIVDAGGIDQVSQDLPALISLVELLGPEIADDSATVVDRWHQNGSIPDGSGRPHGYTPTLRALVGQAAHGAYRIDLRENGPHALVGGTTGAGKSEFLQSWVLGMAAEYSPSRLTFLFVDYKGGSAFAQTTRLPHCVGLVTDLNTHLVRRALVSLRSELHYRETLFNSKNAKDILELEGRGDPECPPALVIVIDEFAALVSDVPEFVDGVVDIAQRGRSLGIHLIMATQRPAGVIKDNLRANTNLRVALRMADESDSRDVIDDVAAALISPEERGRGLIKSGPGRLTAFQSAYSGGHSDAQNVEREVEVASFLLDAPQVWSPPEQQVSDVDPGPTDQERIVTTVVRASEDAALPAPRRPWLDELPALVNLETLGAVSDGAIPFGLADNPQRQSQSPLLFVPDTDQNLAVFGAGGAGRTGVLRAIATAAGHSSDGPVHVYGLEFGGTGLRMLEALPHVASVVRGDDTERVMRMTSMLTDMLMERTRRFGAVDAASIGEYRSSANAPDEPRILVLLDGFPTFKSEYDSVAGRSQAYDRLASVMQEGRAVGIHVVITADRPAGINNSVLTTMLKRLVLRMADQDGYGALSVPKDVVHTESPPGRGLVRDIECQIASPGGLSNPREVGEYLARIAPDLPAATWAAPIPVGALPTEYPWTELPSTVEDFPVAGLSDDNLAPHGFDPTGVFIVAGPAMSGRTSALTWFAASLRRWNPQVRLVALSSRRGGLATRPWWTASGPDIDSIPNLMDMADESAAGGPPLVVMVEAVTDFGESPSETTLVTLMKRARRGDLLVVVESEVGEFGGFGTLMNELRAAKRGLALMPEMSDGDAVFRTAFPRVRAAEFTPGRGLWVDRGRISRMQLPLPVTDDEVPPQEQSTAPAVERTPDPGPLSDDATQFNSQPESSAPPWSLSPLRDPQP